MTKFDITILGCGAALPTLRHFTTTQVLNVHEKFFMLDCCEAAQILFLQADQLKFGKLDHIFISHRHGDHCFGLPCLLSSMSLMGRVAPLHLYMTPDLEPNMRQVIDFFCHIPFEIVFHTLNPDQPERIYEDKELVIESIPMNHGVPCCGFLFKEKQKPNRLLREKTDAYGIPVTQLAKIKDGADYVLPDGTVIPNNELTEPIDELPKSYAFCSDTLFNPNMFEQLRDVDVLYHEATFSDADKDRAIEWKHSTAKQAAETARAVNAKQLVIGHYSTRYDEAALLAEAAAVFPNTVAAYDGMTITLPEKTKTSIQENNH